MICHVHFRSYRRETTQWLLEVIYIKSLFRTYCHLASSPITHVFTKMMMGQGMHLIRSINGESLHCLC